MSTIPVFVEFARADDEKVLFVGSSLQDILEDTDKGTKFGNYAFSSHRLVDTKEICKLAIEKDIPFFQQGVNAVKGGTKSYFLGSPKELPQVPQSGFSVMDAMQFQVWSCLGFLAKLLTEPLISALPNGHGGEAFDFISPPFNYKIYRFQKDGCRPQANVEIMPDGWKTPSGIVFHLVEDFGASDWTIMGGTIWAPHVILYDKEPFRLEFECAQAPGHWGIKGTLFDRGGESRKILENGLKNFQVDGWWRSKDAKSCPA